MSLNVRENTKAGAAAVTIIEASIYVEKLGVLERTTEAKRAETLKVFTGPSVDLHRWAMTARERLSQSPDFNERQSFFKAIYAVLPAWGMHRMGRSGTKMPYFEEFAASLEAAWPSIATLWNATPNLDDREWAPLERAYRAIKARAGYDQDATQIVSRSKVLAHLLPNICAPIDRRYTLTFFGIDACHQDRVKRQDDYEWRLYREMHAHFFHRFASDPRYQGVASWRGGFGRTPLKVADDLIVVNTPKRQPKTRKP